jgi:hypothetical protein
MKSRRARQLETLQQLNEDFKDQGCFWVVIGGWAKEGYLKARSPHKDIDIVGECLARFPQTLASVDAIWIERDPQGSLWWPIGLGIRGYLPPLGAKVRRVVVDGISFPALPSETLLLLTVGLKPWVPHFGGEPVEKYQETYEQLKGIADPKVVRQIRKDGFGFWFKNVKIGFAEKIVRYCLGSVQRQ